MGFFRDPQSRIPIPGIRDRGFLFWARSKNLENPKKKPERKILRIPKKSQKKNRRNPKKSRKKNPKNRKMPEIGIGIIKPRKNLGGISVGISRSDGAQELKKTRDSGFFLVSGFLSPGFGIFYLRDGFFFHGIGYHDKKPTLNGHESLKSKV